jgi:hypothetical protein
MAEKGSSEKEIAVRFLGDRIVELWDIGQPMQPDSPNRDGMF